MRGECTQAYLQKKSLCEETILPDCRKDYSSGKPHWIYFNYINKHILILRFVYMRLYKLSRPISTGWKATSHPLSSMLLTYLVSPYLMSLDSPGSWRPSFTHMCKRQLRQTTQDKQKKASPHLNFMFLLIWTTSNACTENESEQHCLGPQTSMTFYSKLLSLSAFKPIYDWWSIKSKMNHSLSAHG